MTDAIKEAVASAMDGKPNTTKVNPEALAKKKVFDLQLASDGFNTELAYLIKGYLPANAFGVVYGPSKSFKSFHAISWAACIATGTSWNNCKVHKGVVVYVVAEGGAGASKRFRGWEQHYHGSKQIGDLFTIRQPVFTGDKEQVEMLINTIHDVEKQTGEKVVLVVLDTLARCFAGADENRTADMNLFIAGCDQIKAVTGVTVLVVHHAGKGRTDVARGSSALSAAADFEFRINRPEDDDRAYILTHTKSKDSEEHRRLMFSMSERFLFTDSDNDDVCTLVPGLVGSVAPREDESVADAPTISSTDAILKAVKVREQKEQSTYRQLIIDDLKYQKMDVSNFARDVKKLTRKNLLEQDKQGNLHTIK